jgi:REP element-mobilizing transposase RayT
VSSRGHWRKDTVPRRSEVLPIELRGWHSRGYLPHFDAGEVTQSITFRLADSLPVTLQQQWREELQLSPRLPTTARLAALTEERRRIETYLNLGIGPTWLAQPRIGKLVEDALRHFDGDRYRLHAWVIMPNHVHVLITPCAEVSISRVVSSWKSFTATRANALLDRRGAFWQEDYFDRFIRDERHFVAAVSYIENNPVVAGLCATPDSWPFSSARWRDEIV